MLPAIKQQFALSLGYFFVGLGTRKFCKTIRFPIGSFTQTENFGNWVWLQKRGAECGLDYSFDYLLEYTCFCAIDPKRRTEYADLVDRLLKPGGTYIDLAFPLDGRGGGSVKCAVICCSKLSPG